VSDVGFFGWEVAFDDSPPCGGEFVVWQGGRRGLGCVLSGGTNKQGLDLSEFAVKTVVTAGQVVLRSRSSAFFS
jgi:hypothetical protein